MYLDILILAHLVQEPSHGYELKRRVAQSLGSEFAINNNVLYPSLRRFEEMGAVEREVERQLGKPDRHVYRVTERGRSILQDLLRDFPPEAARDPNEFHTRVAFFDLLEPEGRSAILAARRAAVEEHIGHLNRVLEEHALRQEQPYAAKVVEFQRDQYLHELRWIDELAEASQRRSQ
jgi:DNA-binding PadR family transcriptional regulator